MLVPVVAFVGVPRIEQRGVDTSVSSVIRISIPHDVSHQPAEASQPVCHEGFFKGAEGQQNEACHVGNHFPSLLQVLHSGLSYKANKFI